MEGNAVASYCLVLVLVVLMGLAGAAMQLVEMHRRNKLMGCGSAPDAGGGRAGGEAIDATHGVGGHAGGDDDENRKTKTGDDSMRITNLYEMPRNNEYTGVPRLLFPAGADPLATSKAFALLEARIEGSKANDFARKRARAVLDSLTSALVVETSAIAEALDVYDRVLVTSGHATGLSGSDAFCAVFDAPAKQAAASASAALPEDLEPMFALAAHLAARYELTSYAEAANYDDYDGSSSAPTRAVTFTLASDAELLPAMAVADCITRIAAQMEKDGRFALLPERDEVALRVRPASAGLYGLSCVCSWAEAALRALFGAAASAEEVQEETARAQDGAGAEVESGGAGAGEAVEEEE